MSEHIVVVGAGVTGAAIAFRLAQSGARVTVVETAMPAAGASGRSFGWINASFSLDDHHFRLRVEAMEACHRLAADIGGDCMSWPGAISWEDGPDAQARTFARLTAAGYPVRRLSRAEIAGMEPALPAPPDSALMFPSEGVTDLARLTGHLLRAACGHGARLMLGLPATGVETRAGRVTGLATEEGPIGADRIVFAAGNGTPALLAPLGIPLPMVPRPAIILRTRPLPPMLRHVLVTPAMELRQEPDGRLLVPASANHQADSAEALAATPEALARDALDRLCAIFPDKGLQWQEAIRAFRPVPADGRPVVGRCAVDGLYIAVMHSGATLAALVGELAAREITADADAEILAPYRPARFA